jgi:DNA polymerase III epsilon subunit-like protein
MNEDLDTLRMAAIEQDRCFSKGRLRDDFRMKPKPGVEPVTYYKNGFGGKFAVYRIADCIPMRPIKTGRSEKQKKAAKRLGIMSKLKSGLAQAGKRAADWLVQDCFVLDTETTGLSDKDQIIEIAVCDVNGKICYEQRILPSVLINPKAEEIHGISLDDLAERPNWPEIANDLKTLLTGQTVVIYNSNFDLDMLRSTSQAFQTDDAWLNTLNIRCAMELSVQAFGATNRYGTISLANAADAAGVSWPGEAHSAKVDALVTLGVLRTLSDHYHRLHIELEELC